MLFVFVFVRKIYDEFLLMMITMMVMLIILLFVEGTIYKEFFGDDNNSDGNKIDYSLVMLVTILNQFFAGLSLRQRK